MLCKSQFRKKIPNDWFCVPESQIADYYIINLTFTNKIRCELCIIKMTASIHTMSLTDHEPFIMIFFFKLLYLRRLFKLFWCFFHTFSSFLSVSRRTRDVETPESVFNLNRNVTSVKVIRLRVAMTGMIKNRAAFRRGKRLMGER